MCFVRQLELGVCLLYFNAEKRNSRVKRREKVSVNDM